MPHSPPCAPELTINTSGVEYAPQWGQLGDPPLSSAPFKFPLVPSVLDQNTNISSSSPLPMHTRKGKSRARCNSTEGSPSICRCKRASISSSPPSVSVFSLPAAHSAPPSPALRPPTFELFALPTSEHAAHRPHLKRPVPDPRGFAPLDEYLPFDNSAVFSFSLYPSFLFSLPGSLIF